jgi:penicillin-insensitive murein endopeptidase
MGMLHPASVLDKDGHVMTNVFVPQKNWDYWRSIVGQRYAKNGRVQSIVGMILVDPRIKTFLCDWAKTNKMLDDPLNQAVMTRLYPTEGHDDHFHVRLLCSPYHTQCTGEFTPSKLGCD